MIDYKEASTALSGLVGWEQNSDSSGLQLTAALVATRSGLVFNRHPMLDTDNLLAIAPNWIQELTAAAKPAALSAWITTQTDKAILQTMTKWWSKKGAANTARPLISVRDAYWYDNTLLYGDAPETRLGVRLKPTAASSPLMRVKLHKIGLRFSSPVTVTVNLQMEDEKAPLDQTLTFAYTGNGAEEWLAAPAEWNIATSGRRGFFVFYDTDENTPLVVDYRGSCNCRMSSRLFSVTGIATDATTEVMKPAVTRENYGLNLKLEVNCDYTQLLINQERMFANLVSLQVADHFLRLMAANPSGRLNRNEGMQNPDRLLYQVDGDPRGRLVGIAEELRDAYKSTMLDRSGNDELCLPCNEDAGITRTRL